MSEKHLYENGEFTIVASSIDEAKLIWDEETGTTRDLYNDDEAWEDAHEIYQVPDNRILTIFIEDELANKPDGLVITDSGCQWKATAKAWAQSQPRGYLCCTEF